MHDHRWSLMLYLRSSQNSIIISESISTACTKKIFNCTAFKFRDIHKTPARKDVHHTSHKWEWTVTDARRTQRTPWKLNANLPNHSKILHKNSRRMRERGEKKTNYAPTDYTRYYYRQYIFMHNTARFSNSLLRSQMAPADVCVCVSDRDSADWQRDPRQGGRTSRYRVMMDGGGGGDDHMRRRQCYRTTVSFGGWPMKKEMKTE